VVSLVSVGVPLSTTGRLWKTEKRSRNPKQTEEAVQELLHKYLEEVEKMVLRYPEQWFNYYSFWKEQELN